VGLKNLGSHSLAHQSSLFATDNGRYVNPTRHRRRPETHPHGAESESAELSTLHQRGARVALGARDLRPGCKSKMILARAPRVPHRAVSHVFSRSRTDNSGFVECSPGGSRSPAKSEADSERVTGTIRT